MKSNMITNMLFVKTLSPRFHKKHLEIVVVLKGTITVHKLDRTEVCHEGQFVIINKNITHWFESAGAYILVSKIDLSQFKHIYEKIEYVEFYYLKQSVDDDLKKRLNAIIVDCVIKNFIYRYYFHDMKENFLNENQLMSTLYSFYRLNSFRKDDDEYISNELLDRYYYVVEYVNRHIHEKIIVDDILKYVYMNSTYFSQFMKKTGGLGFKEFVSYIKFANVVQCLVKDDMTMMEIATKVGMTDMKSFYNSFKKYLHMSPSKWRKSISSLTDCYLECFDDLIIKMFIHKYDIINHYENTITKSYKTLLEYQMQKTNLQGTQMRIEPFKDMKPDHCQHYQVYKNFTLLARKALELGVRMDFIIPVHFLKLYGQEKLLKSLLLEHTRLYSPQDLKFWSITLLAKDKNELRKAKYLKSDLYHISKHLIINIDIY